MAKILLDRDAEFEDAAFMAAVNIYETHPVFLERLLQKGANVDAWEENSGSALHVALQSRCGEAFWLLLAKNPYINAVNKDGSVLLHAIARGLKDIVRELLRRGADPNRQVEYDTPFTEAVLRATDGELEVVELLLEKGADVNGGNGLA